MGKPGTEEIGARGENFGVDTARRFFSGTGSSYDLIANLCTVGMDIPWKTKIIEKIPPNCRHIVDQACGTGILTFKIARRFPYCRVTGVELRDEYLNVARQKARAMRLRNVEFILGRVEDVRLDALVDGITSSYLAKYAELGSLEANGLALRSIESLTLGTSAIVAATARIP